MTNPVNLQPYAYYEGNPTHMAVKLHTFKIPDILTTLQQEDSHVIFIPLAMVVPYTQY